MWIETRPTDSRLDSRLRACDSWVESFHPWTRDSTRNSGHGDRDLPCDSAYVTRQQPRLFMIFLFVQKDCGGDQCLLSGTFTEGKARRPWLVLGWVTTREDRALWTWVSRRGLKSVTDLLYSRYRADTDIKWINTNTFVHIFDQAWHIEMNNGPF